MTRTRGRGTVLALVIGALAIVPVLEMVASAHNFRARSSISIRYGNGAFRGRVDSARRFCRGSRSVSVYKARSGRDRRIGGDITSRQGYWSVPKGRARGRFYAVVSARRVSSYGHNHRCNGAASRTIRRGGRRTATVGTSGETRDDRGDTVLGSRQSRESSAAAEGETAPAAQGEVEGQAEVPFSGSDVIPWVVTGVGLIGVGALFVAWRRRSRASS